MVEGLLELTKEEQKLLDEKGNAFEQDLPAWDKNDIRYRVWELLIQKKRYDATEIIVKHIMETEHIYTTRDDEKSEMWIYKEGIYVPQARTYIHEHCRYILSDAYTTGLGNNVIAKIEADTYIEQDEFFKTNNIDFVAVENGILNLKTRELGQFNPEMKFFNKMPVKYDKDAECPNIDKFLSSVLENDSDVKTLEELFGFLLYDNYFIEKSIMFFGTGRNGKGKTIKLMKVFIGIDNCAEIPLEDLEKDIYALGELFKKKANLSGDLGTTALKNTGNFKKLTGRDMISAARKFLTRVHFENYAKMIFAANELPITYDITPAFWNRWIIIDFPYYFLTKEQTTDKEEIEKIPDDKKGFIREADPHIIENIITPEELSGLLNRALVGLDRLLSNNDFTGGESSSRVKEKWQMRSDSCMGFVTSELEEDYTGFIIKSTFKEKYTKFCRKHKLKIATDKRIKNIIETQLGGMEEKKTIYEDGEKSQLNCWIGIGFKSKAKDIDIKGIKDINGFPTPREKVKSPKSLKTYDKVDTLDSLQPKPVVG